MHSEGYCSCRVCVSVSQSVPWHLTSRAINHSTNNTTNSASGIGRKICGVVSETSTFESYYSTSYSLSYQSLHKHYHVFSIGYRLKNMFRSYGVKHEWKSQCMEPEICKGLKQSLEMLLGIVVLGIKKCYKVTPYDCCKDSCFLIMSIYLSIDPQKQCE